MRSSVPTGAWETTCVTLLGDAIDVMSPAIGVTVLRDAQVLSRLLAEVPTGRRLVEAVHAHEGEMIGYGFDAVRESAARGHKLVGQDPLPSSEITA